MEPGDSAKVKLAALARYDVLLYAGCTVERQLDHPFGVRKNFFLGGWWRAAAQ